MRDTSVTTSSTNNTITLTNTHDTRPSLKKWCVAVSAKPPGPGLDEEVADVDPNQMRPIVNSANPCYLEEMTRTSTFKFVQVLAQHRHLDKKRVWGVQPQPQPPPP